MKVFAGIMLAYTLCESRLASTATTMQVLQYSNVETFVVFRASTPLLISLADYAFLGRELPSMRSVSHPLRAATETEMATSAPGLRALKLKSKLKLATPKRTDARQQPTPAPAAWADFGCVDRRRLRCSGCWSGRSATCTVTSMPPRLFLSRFGALARCGTASGTKQYTCHTTDTCHANCRATATCRCAGRPRHSFVQQRLPRASPLLDGGRLRASSACNMARRAR